MSKFDGSKVDVRGVSCVGNKGFNDRYSLTIPLIHQANVANDTVIVIMKNPASTARQNVFYKVGFSNITDVDKTTTKLINYLFSFTSYKTIITVNLFPYYSANPQDLNAIYGVRTNTGYQFNSNPSYQKNMIEIGKIFKANATVDVICAWGQESNMSKAILDNAIDDIINLINNHSIKNVYQFISNNGNTSLQQISVSINNKFYPLHASRI